MEDATQKKSRVLIVGGTGYIGRRMVWASLKEGHPTYVLARPENEMGLDIEKVQLLISFKMAGANLLRASLDDHDALVGALRQVDVVVSALAGNHVRSHAILQQLKLVKAMKAAGNIKRFIPSEFGMDADLMTHALEPGNVTFADKRAVRRAVEAAGIPYTYLPAGCFAGYFIGGLAQMGRLTPPKSHVILYGDGNTKVAWVDEDDVATYAIKCVDDRRAENKTVYVLPPENVLSQREVVECWEKLSGASLQKTELSARDFLALVRGRELVEQIGMTHFYHIFYEGSVCNVQIKSEDGKEDASVLFPDVQYMRVHQYMKRFL